ncbi:single-stranded-DNA-specific exonuclease RecJ [Treponema peruense]|uniref:Single-stranded-DNA-specific exonuclease RecJ n=1 Tax=Treponema peruense TaxID=2787628 RepID=A0A7T3RFI8_9SPIR|nr:single-stranded-DNA-specific exonuclease RecJ [Treponema peruense]QQA02104.1 single-stranded-DNA-specific exonuclease RecJ [Treponema peruense]
MSEWFKKQISKTQVESVSKKYSLDPITASIMVRRGITSGSDILYYIEDDLRFQHSPFMFAAMEDAVDRILDAKEENEKVLIFGDRDVDGVTSTTVLYDCLSSMGIDVSYKLPGGDDAYGLSIQAVEEFAANYGSLIITVDCGISNNAEIAKAAELGLDVIVVDHHNAPETLPSPAIIIDPKTENSGYPFPDISGCAVVYKLVSAIRFSQSSWYKQDVTLLNVNKENSAVECVKVRNLVPVSRLTQTIDQNTASLSDTNLPSYLQGQLLLAWDAKTLSQDLQSLFGDGAQFNLVDIREEAAKLFPKFASMTLTQLKGMSKMAKYGDHEPTEIGGFYNIFVTWVQKSLAKDFPSFAKAEEKDLQLVALAALADIMPMKNENRIFVKNGLKSINSGRIRPGLRELMAELNLTGKRINSIDLSWVVVAHLNAAGRLGQPELAAKLFITDSQNERLETAKQIIELNAERKQLCVDAWNYAGIQAKASIPLHSNKLCVVIDERINRGVSGILAGRLVSTYNVPAMTVTIVDGIAIGSMRSCRDYDVTQFLNKMDDLFINHGGHNFAAGFSFKRERLAEFEERIKTLSSEIKLGDTKDTGGDIDAEIPAQYLTPALLDISDRFEPYGEENPQLLFMAKNIRVASGQRMGKGEKMHLKITVDCGKYKWPCIFWNEGERLGRDFNVGDRVDFIFRVERNVFNRIETPQINLVDIKKSDNL